MKAQVIFNKCSYGKIAVIITRLNTQHQWPVSLARQLRQFCRLELIGKKLITIPLIHQYRQLMLCMGQ